MDLAVIHNINDPEEWKRALALDQQFPPELHASIFVEAADGERALCLWAPPAKPNSRAARPTFGHAAVNGLITCRV